MKNVGAIFLVAVVLISSARAEQSVELQRALQPLRDGVPAVSIQLLQNFLAQNPSLTDRTTAQIGLAQAFVEANRPEQALTTVSDASLTNNFDAIYWQAQALAALSRWAEAKTAYARAASAADEALRAAAIFGESQCARALGQSDEALELLTLLQTNPRWQIRASLGMADLLINDGKLAQADKLLRDLKVQRPGDRNERRFLFARVNLAAGRTDRALEILTGILKNPEGVPYPLLVATLFAIADAHLREKTPEQGDDFLENFIDQHPDDTALPQIFAKLDELYRAEKKSSPNELEKWMRDPAEPRRSFAQWYFARGQMRAGDRDGALQSLMNLRTDAMQLPSLGDAYLDLARLLLDGRQWDGAIGAAESARRQNPGELSSRADWLSAEANYRAGQLEAAAAIFEKIAREQPRQAGAALYNAALCWLRLNRADNFSSDYRQISDQPATQPVQGELLLEQATLQASQNQPEAAASFAKFIRDFPHNPRISEAWVALADLAFHANKPDLATAKIDLAKARQMEPTPAARERADYLEIWLADAAPSPNESQVIGAAKFFLEQYPRSASAADARMKLAETYFREQDFADAQNQFELIAQQNPSGPLVENALFFAARAVTSTMGAASLDHALALFDQVVKMNGELKWTARNEQAEIERRLGKNNEAIAIYDEVLKNDAKAPERREALCGKGDVLAEMGAADPENYRRAIELFEQLADEPGVPAHWRNQAEFKKGKALEELNDKAGALTTYYSVIDESTPPDQQHEFFWYYKAGFSAAHLLEEASDWKSAVAVYRKLAAVGGARTEEAKTRLTQLRLEHFLWDE